MSERKERIGNMDCDKFEELLIDFIGNNLSQSQMKAIKKHLVVCPDCAREVEDYKQIKRILKEESSPQLSPELLAKLAERAKKQTGGEKPFWRRRFYSSALVPALSFTIALFFWFSYGEEAFKSLGLRGDISSTSVIARKVSPPAEQDSSRLEDKSELNPAAENPPPAQAPLPDAGPQIQAVASPAPVQIEPQPVVQAPALNESEPPADAEPQSTKSLEIAGASSLYSPPQGAPPPQAQNAESRFALALRLQKEGNCEKSVKISQELLLVSVADALREKIYLSLAECYEFMRNWDMAIANYNNLQMVAPRKSGYARGKIGSITRTKANAAR
ncbi:MAG: zf-HC2 domain-containing protein [Deltaproteobacteria bacterium]